MSQHATAGFGLDRRRLFQVLAAGGLAGMLGPRRLEAQKLAAGSNPRVVVVGAGLSGLAAARRLRQAGVAVRVFELAGRAGGRIQTLHAPFADGLSAEAGGDAIGSSYTTVLGLVRELGLSVVPGEGAAARRRTDVLIDLDGAGHRLSALRREPSAWGPGLNEAEQAVAPFGLLNLYLGPLARELADPAKVLEPRWLELDALSLDELLVDRGATPAARRMIDHVLNANGTTTVSALSVLRELTRRLAGGRGTFRIAGGNDRLPQAMALGLGDAIHYGSRLHRVAQTETGVRLTIEQGGLHDTVDADAVVLTLPCAALRQIELDPPLPDDRARAIAELPYTQITKTYVQARRRFWHDDLKLSAVWSDGPYERLFDYGSAPEGPRGLLLSWINGDGAIAMASPGGPLSPKVLAHVRRLFPDHAHLLETTTVVDWSQTPSQGAYAHFAPGQMRAWATDLGRPHGRLVFAGEHTEVVHPGMEGALRSGHRAAEEALALLVGDAGPDS